MVHGLKGGCRMNQIKNLEELRREVAMSGPIIKDNYKELCKWIGWEPSTNRKAQFASMKRFMSVEKVEGDIHKYIVKDIYPVKEKKKHNPTGRGPGRPRKNPDITIKKKESICKRPVGRPRTKAPSLTIKELEERQGYSLYFRSNNKYLEPAFHILGHIILNKDEDYAQFSHKGLMYRLGMIDYDMQYNDSCIAYLDRNPGMFSFWFYSKIVCESILYLSILNGLCDRKNIFEHHHIYFNADVNAPYEYNPFGTEAENKIIESIIQDVLKNYELETYNELFYPKSGFKSKAFDARCQIDKEVYHAVGWKYWGRGHQFSFNPKIPKESIEYLKNHDISQDLLIMHQYTCDRLRAVHTHRNQKYLGYNPNYPASNQAAVGKTNVTIQEAYDRMQGAVEYIIDNYMNIVKT